MPSNEPPQNVPAGLPSDSVGKSTPSAAVGDPLNSVAHVGQQDFEPTPTLQPPQIYPTAWQKKIMWSALTALAIAVLGGLAVSLLLGVGKVLGFFQPLLIPVAVAGILAFLLKPLVDRFMRRGLSPTAAVLGVFALMILLVTGIGFWIGPELYEQSSEFAVKLPGDTRKGLAILKEKAHSAILWYQLQNPESPYISAFEDWVQQTMQQLPQLLPTLATWLRHFLNGGFHGFLGVAGFLLSLMFVPVYLFFFLINAEAISQRWSHYLPLRASPFKDEVVDCLMEINHYLIAFFRGQVLVTLIDGFLISVCLWMLGLKFALFIGLMVTVLQLIPYLGVTLCWIPSVLIAFAQWNDWLHPVLVTGVFLLVFKLEGFLISPKIVGNAVGLHPMTIILSMLAWGLLMGGLLGALLAVPLTATVKVLLRRYVWRKGERKLSAEGVGG